MKWSDMVSLLKGSIYNFSGLIYIHKRVYRNDQKNLPSAFEECPRSLYFILLLEWESSF